MAGGRLTAEVARKLATQLQDPRFEVLFDHGDAKIDPPTAVGNISSWFGSSYSSGSQLADLDIAVVERKTDNAVVLVEVEETSSTPKVILGDAFGTLLGDHVTFQGRRLLNLGDFTGLLILLRSGSRDRLWRLDYIKSQVSQLRTAAATQNSTVGDVSIEAFAEDGELIKRLLSYLTSRIASYPGS
jgi:hypothetical protein